MKRYLLCVAVCLIFAGCATEADSDLENIQCGNTICENGLFCCNDTCVDLENSLEYCGSCTNSCPFVSNSNMHVTQSACMNRQCTYVCESGYMDMDFDASNGCETSLSGCGNHKLDSGEVCDSEILNGWTCTLQLGLEATGLPKCNSTCNGFEIGTCAPVSNKPVNNELCDNGKLDSEEICDGERLNGQTCASVVGTGSYGRLKCKADCSGFDISECSEISGGNKCGNSSIDTGERCDGNLINGQTCASVMGTGYTGTLRCKSDCSDFDTSSCQAPSVNKCGNTSIDTGERCDGSLLNGQTCASVMGTGYTGTLRCKSDCSDFDTSSCQAPSVNKCGNTSIDTGERCDGNLLNGQTCASVMGAGYTGTLRCKSDCSDFDTSSCQSSTSCIPDDERCVGLSLQVCNDDGQWVEEEVCDSFCDVDNGGCLSACTKNNDILCSNNTLLICNNHVWEVKQACEDGYTCDEIKKSCQISCQHDTRRCENNHLFICHDNDIGEDEIVCDGACINGAGCSLCDINSDCLSNRCNSTTHQCEVASTAKYYESDFEWMKSMIKNNTKTSYTTEYIQPNTSGYVLKVHGRADVITELIDGQAVMLNNNTNSYIEISGMTGGVNIVVFDVVGYDNTTVSVTAAGMTQTSSVFKNEIKTMAFTFNNNADKILIKADNRVTIDNLGWSSMK